MRRKLYLMMTVVSLFFVFPAAAQENIDKLMEELEKQGVDVNTLVRRNDQKQVYFKSKSLSFRSKEGVYAKKLEEAFDKDSENATSESTYKAGGSVNVTLTYKSEKKSAIYTLRITNVKGTPEVSVSVVLRDNSVEQKKNSESFIWGLNDLDDLRSRANEFKVYNATRDSIRTIRSDSVRIQREERVKVYKQGVTKDVKDNQSMAIAYGHIM